jgi:hypothetical protein
MRILSNGHFLLIGKEDTTMDLSSYPFFNRNGSFGSATATVKCGVIQELDANKIVVFEWHSKDHYSFDDVDSTFLNDPSTVDWTHFNSIEEDTDGNLLLSVRHFDEITKIDRQTGNIIWRLGGKRSSFTFPNDPQMFRGQHEARRIANGNITMLDNGGLNPLHPVQAKEYALDMSLMNATLQWSYMEQSTVYSMSTGNVQRLQNGNTLVNYGNTNNLDITFNVVDSVGSKVFEIVFDDTLSSFRASNYETLPWNLNRPQISCLNISGQQYLDAGPGFSSYRWSTGATIQTIPVTVADTYFVFVNAGIGFLSSEKLIVTDPNDPCLLNGVDQMQPVPSVSLAENPFSSDISLRIHSLKSSESIVTIYNLNGQKVFSQAFLTGPGNQQLIVPADHLVKGFYNVMITTEKGELIQSIKAIKQ